MIYDLDNQPNIPFRKFRSFANDSARNDRNFDIDNSSSSHTDNRKNNFLVLGEEPTDDINGSIGIA